MRAQVALRLSLKRKKAAQSGLLAGADAVGALGANGAADAFEAACAADACG